MINNLGNAMIIKYELNFYPKNLNLVITNGDLIIPKNHPKILLNQLNIDLEIA